MWKRVEKRATETNRTEEDDEVEVFAVIIDSVMCLGTTASFLPFARELSNCSPPIFDFRHHFWLCNRHPCARRDGDKHPPPSPRRRRRNQISNQKAFSSLTHLVAF